MRRIARYLTHPQVIVDSKKPIEKWGLNAIGQARVDALVLSITTERDHPLRKTKLIVSSAETKAIEAAKPIAEALGCALIIREKMHENDRSATGFLPPDEFELVADQFFTHPDKSIYGWETASAAQSRMLLEVDACLTNPDFAKIDDSDILFVGHGAVGTLLYCAYSNQAIDRSFDQGFAAGVSGGGNIFTFDLENLKSISHWQAMEEL
tara:strand:- start:1390 stop:2016 length:627 start_codon:yes stop_codon:yes gene_type:complete